MLLLVSFLTRYSETGSHSLPHMEHRTHSILTLSIAFILVS